MLDSLVIVVEDGWNVGQCEFILHKLDQQACLANGSIPAGVKDVTILGECCTTFRTHSTKCFDITAGTYPTHTIFSCEDCIFVPVSVFSLLNFRLVGWLVGWLVSWLVGWL